MALPLLGAVAAGIAIRAFSRLQGRRRRAAIPALWTGVNVLAGATGVWFAVLDARIALGLARLGRLTPPVPWSFLVAAWWLCGIPILLLAGSAVSWVLLARVPCEGG